MTNPGLEEQGYEKIGKLVNDLLIKLDNQIEDADIKLDMKRALSHLVDLRFSLNESSIVAVTDHKGTIKYINDKFCQISKYEREELIGKDHRIINSGYHSKSFMKEMWMTISSGTVWRGDIKNRAKDGSYYWVNTTIVPFLNEQGSPYQYLAIRNEVTELKRVQEELQQMMKHVLSIQEEERRRFSRELHDGIGQSLFSLLIQLDRMKQEVQHPSIENVRTSVSHIIEDVRSLAWELRPSVLDDLGVAPAIRTYIDNYTEHYGIKVDISNNLRRRLEAETETSIYRIIQEALTNIGKYANVDTVKLTIRDSTDHIEVRIEDKGNGFNQDVVRKGVGLFSMSERARSIGGHLSIHSQLGHGTEIVLIIPHH